MSITGSEFARLTPNNNTVRPQSSEHVCLTDFFRPVPSQGASALTLEQSATIRNKAGGLIPRTSTGHVFSSDLQRLRGLPAGYVTLWKDG